ncbi:transcription termination factor MTERF8, chloroplastic [Sesamum indicum]|uniref:Transcription termination factor MTERF8, chloroplastic n=1 Tax=Sesamum indicum TaxID=4182 RepID=A0A6I9T8S0_SESIN|nr:transcription termination factor MTERF8, chloroplastic [Sesamum indicum]
MLLRPILSRIQNNRRSANFSLLKNVGPSIASLADATSSKEKSQEKAYVISYLVNACGLSPEKAISASKKVHFDAPDKPDAVLNFLEKQGFSKTQVAELVRRQPRVLVSNPQKVLLPKIEVFLQLTGASEEEVFRTITVNPYILTRSVEHRLAPVYGYLKDIIGVGKVETLLRRGSWIFNIDLENRIMPNVDFLREIGVPQSCIEFSLFHCAEIFLPKYAKFKQIVEEVKHMGFATSKTTFILAIHARTGKSNLALWDRSYEVYSKWGWSKDDIHMAFIKHPNCMLLSEKKISAAMDFLINKVEQESRSVARCPQILFYNMERRIVPRCSVVHLLSLKGLVKKDWSLGSVLCPVEKDFIDKYVTKYTGKLPQLYDVYLSSKPGVVEA